LCSARVLRAARDGARRAARLARAAAFEVILVLRGRLRPSSRPGRWRIRLSGGGGVTFAADAVVAATPLPRSARR